MVSSTYDYSYNMNLSYFQFYYKLNYIEYFYYYSKNYLRYLYKYSFKKLCILIPEALASIIKFIILKNYNCCKRKIILYKAEIE